MGVSDGMKGLLSGEQTAGRRGLCVMGAFYIHLRLIIQFIPSQIHKWYEGAESPKHKSINIFSCLK